MEGNEENVGAGGLVALAPTPAPLTPPHLTLGGGEATVVTLQEAGQCESLLLYPVDEEGSVAPAPTASTHLSPEATITYATLDAGGNFVLQAGSTPTQPQGGKAPHGPPEGQLVVVGETRSGEPITYIYIQGESEDGDKEEEGHTITLNSADGSALHTLPAPYTHSYGDLVLVAPPHSTEDPTRDTPAGQGEEGDGGQQDDQVLLLSVGSLKMEDGGQSGAAPPPCSTGEEDKQGGNRPKVTLEEVQGQCTDHHQKDSTTEKEEEEEEEDTSFEARLATRDSLLPPRRTRRSSTSGCLTCPVCDTQFKSNRQYHSHIQVHHDQESWHCNICQHTCDSIAALRTHKATAHQAARPFSCPHCPLRFPKSLVLEDHVRSVHNKERPYGCTFCPKAFYRPHDLKMHLNLHLGIKTKVCHVCGRQFSHSSNLIRHQRLHTGVKPYVCSECGKRFKQVTLLHKHRVVHQSGAGACPLCSVTLHSAPSLRKHYKLEHKKTMTLKEAARILRGQRGTVVRSFYCQVCGAQFNVKSELKAHEAEAHSGSGQHHCASCDRVYPMNEVKTHPCLTQEEERLGGGLLALSAQEAVMTAITPEASSTQDHPSGTPVSSDDPEPQREEEEEYLVMYITPEGESVSYMMKKGTKVSRDQVLQVNAQNDQLGAEEVFGLSQLPHSEETIMINVHNTDQDHSLLVDQEEDGPVTPAAPILDQASPLPLHTIKLEPQGGDEVTLDKLPTRNKPLLPLVNLASPKREVNPPVAERTLKEVIKTENEEEIEKKPEVQQGATKVPLVCKTCGKTFSKQWNFRQHIATHNPSLHRYRCSECGLTFAYRSTLNKHMDHHKPSLQVQCQHCAKSYKCMASLKQHHKRDHEKHRPYVCELCGKDFFSKSDYTYHMRLHKKEHPYICLFCGQEFSHSSHLHRHERVHTGERPHKCPICPKTFIQYVTLKIHLKKHEKQDPDANAIASATTTATTITPAATTTRTTTAALLNERLPEAANVTLKLSMAREGDGAVDEASLVAERATGEEVTGITGGLSHDTVPQAHRETFDSSLGQEQLPSGTIILTEGGQGAGHFAGSRAAVVTGVDGDCIAIFVQEGLS